MVPPEPVANFIVRWAKAEAAERANYALIITQLRRHSRLFEVPLNW